MSNYVWLCEYDSSAVANTYGIVIQTEDYDGAERFWLEHKEWLGELNNAEQQKLESLQQQSYKFTNAWREREFIKKLPINFFKEPDINYSNLPKKEDIFFRITNGYLIITEKLYDIISQFNLGKTHFSQVYIYDIETKEQLSDIPYYFVNIAEKFEFLDVENSKEISVNQYFPQQRKRWIGEPKDDDILLSLQAKDNRIDLWHDPLLNKSLFFSDRLTQALFQAGFSQKELGLVRCKLV